VKDDVALMM